MWCFWVSLIHRSSSSCARLMRSMRFPESQALGCSLLEGKKWLGAIRCLYSNIKLDFYQAFDTMMWLSSCCLQSWSRNPSFPSTPPFSLRGFLSSFFWRFLLENIWTGCICKPVTLRPPTLITLGAVRKCTQLILLQKQLRVHVVWKFIFMLLYLTYLMCFFWSQTNCPCIDRCVLADRIFH